jgi:hypothetical protein
MHADAVLSLIEMGNVEPFRRKVARLIGSKVNSSTVQRPILLTLNI